MASVGRWARLRAQACAVPPSSAADTTRPPECCSVQQHRCDRWFEIAHRSTGVGIVGQRVVEVDTVHDDRAELHADVVLEREGGLHHLVDRRRLGQGDQHDLASLGIVEQFEHLVGLRTHGTGADGVGQTRRRHEERDGMPGGWTVDDDQIPLA